MIDIAKIIETNKEYVKQHPELPKAGLTRHPTKKLQHSKRNNHQSEPYKKQDRHRRSAPSFDYKKR